MNRFQTVDPVAVPHLYHWQPFVPERLETLISSNSLWLSKPDAFNDPWDCKPYFNTSFAEDSGRVAEHAEWYARITRRYRPDVSEEQISLRKAAFLKNPRLLADLVRQVSVGMWKEIATRYRVYCLGPDVCNLLMWSHYASNHKGICLEFSTSTAIISGAQQVEYLNAFPELRLDSDSGDESLVALLTKSDVWSYEREYRLIAQERGHRTSHDTLITDENLMRVPANSLTAVIVGCQGPLDEVIRTVRNTTNHLLVRKAVRVPNRFALEIEDVQ